MPDTRTIKREIDLPTYFDDLAYARLQLKAHINELLNGICEDHDNIDQAIEQFAFHARFEAIYQYENPS